MPTLVVFTNRSAWTLGFLVADVEAAAHHIAILLGDATLRRNVGRRAQKHFLMTRLLEDCLDAIASLAEPKAPRSLPEELAKVA